MFLHPTVLPFLVAQMAQKASIKLPTLSAFCKKVAHCCSSFGHKPHLSDGESELMGVSQFKTSGVSCSPSVWLGLFALSSSNLLLPGGSKQPSWAWISLPGACSLQCVPDCCHHQHVLIWHCFLEAKPETHFHCRCSEHLHVIRASGSKHRSSRWSSCFCVS